MTVSGAYPEGGVVIGEVPMHLRHLHNLLGVLAIETVAAERRSQESQQRLEAVRTIFLDALRAHAPCGDQFDRARVCEGWQVVGYKSANDEGCGLNLGDLLRAALARQG